MERESWNDLNKLHVNDWKGKKTRPEGEGRGKKGEAVGLQRRRDRKKEGHWVCSRKGKKAPPEGERTSCGFAARERETEGLEREIEGLERERGGFINFNFVADWVAVLDAIYRDIS